MKKQNYLAPALGLALALTLLCSGCGSSDTTDVSPDLTPPDSMSMVKDYDIQTDADVFVGTWLPEGDSAYAYLEITSGDGEYLWGLYSQEDLAASGYLQYEADYDCIYAHNDHDGVGHPITLNDDGSLNLATFGTFVPGHIDFGDDSGDGSWIYISGTDPTGSDTSTNYDTNESGWSAAEADPTAFAGIWYRNGDLDADSFIVIDSDGSWHLYQRAPGAENAEMDYGSIIPSDTEPYTYYAVSDPYGLSYRIFDYDTDEITWGEDNEYYDRLE